MVEIDYRVARLRRILVIVILATLPCYLLGVIVLWVGNSAKIHQTITPTNNVFYITATPQPSSTPLPPTFYPTPTASASATVTPTFTVTVSYTNTPTITITLLPTGTNTPTPLGTGFPTDTSTPEPSPTLPTQISIETAAAP